MHIIVSLSQRNSFSNKNFILGTNTPAYELGQFLSRDVDVIRPRCILPQLSGWEDQEQQTGSGMAVIT